MKNEYDVDDVLSGARLCFEGMENEDGAEREANLDALAPLLLAAPDLLAAVQGFVAWWDEWNASDDPANVGDPDIDGARAAIARASGGLL